MTRRYYAFGVGECPVCRKPRALRAGGRITAHGPHAARCEGTGRKPADNQTKEN
jgi:hypothetical protein